MDNFSITQYGKPLSKIKYTLDLDNKTFSSKHNDLVLDCYNLDCWTFKTGYGCTFNTGNECTFNTGNGCTFLTGDYCTFDTDECCTFMLWNINSHKFKSYDGVSIILDRIDNKHYVLTKELIDMIKVING